MRLVSLLILPLTLLLLWSPPAVAQADDWTGAWQSYWRDGQALLTLQQDGRRVTGTYQPDDGTVAGVVRNGVFYGTWTEQGGTGGFTFAMSPDRQNFAGRFDSGEYWNGYRDTDAGRSVGFRRSDSPRETMRTILTAGNDAVYGSNPGALRFVAPLLIYGGPPSDADDHGLRRTLFWTILDISTFSLQTVPNGDDVAGENVASIRIGPADTSQTVTLDFALDEDGSWKVVLPPQEVLRADLDRLLRARGHETLASLEVERAQSPRGALRSFILGANRWHTGGSEEALATLELSHVPERLRSGEGTIAADYLKRVLDRAGFVIWQEIPDVAAQPTPYVHYRHAEGLVTLAPQADPDSGRVVWQFTRETLEALPRIHAAIETLPLAPGLAKPTPLSGFFVTREAALSVLPDLDRSIGPLAGWQALGLVIGVVAAVAAAAAVTGLVRLAARRPGRGGGLRPLAMSLGLIAGAVILVEANARLGLSQTGLPLTGKITALLLVLAIASFIYALIDLIGDALQRLAQESRGYTDEIVVSLGRGLAKVMVVVGAIVACADVVGLPYEGVLTGLGIGGVALAFAARDTVSNLLGGALLLADRPFKRGDLVEVSGQLATIETVGLRSTRLRTLDDMLLVVPNAQLSDQLISNWTSRRTRRIVLAIGLTYDTPPDKLRAFSQELTRIAKNRPKVDPETVFVGVKALGASSIDLELIACFHVQSYGGQVEVTEALLLDIIALTKELNVSFAFPTRTVHVVSADEAEARPPTLVADHGAVV